MSLRSLTPFQQRVITWGFVAVTVVVTAGLGLAVVRKVAGVLDRTGQAKPPVITQDVVAMRLQEVARLVASEMTLRDVVTYRQTRLGSTKRALLVVTARVSAGISIDKAEVQIDSAARRITVTLPLAEIFGVDVVDVQTYDERDGLLNPFRPADRDLMHQRVRAQLMVSAERSGILQHANESASRIVERLLAVDGYVVEVRRGIVLERPAG
jgi:hypothetical protein